MNGRARAERRPLHKTLNEVRGPRAILKFVVLATGNVLHKRENVLHTREQAPRVHLGTSNRAAARIQAQRGTQITAAASVSPAATTAFQPRLLGTRAVTMAVSSILLLALVIMCPVVSQNNLQISHGSRYVLARFNLPTLGVSSLREYRSPRRRSVNSSSRQRWCFGAVQCWHRQRMGERRR